MVDYKRLYQELLEDVEYQEKFFLNLAREYRADAAGHPRSSADHWHNDGFAQAYSIAYSIAAKFTRSIKEKAQAKETTDEMEVKNYG